MIPLKTLDLYISQINRFSCWGGCPFEWDSQEKKFRQSRNNTRWVMACFYWGCYTLFYTCRLTQFIIFKEYSKVYLIFGTFVLLAVYFLSVAYFILVLRLNDTILLVNSSLAYMHHLNGMVL